MINMMPPENKEAEERNIFDGAHMKDIFVTENGLSFLTFDSSVNFFDVNFVELYISHSHDRSISLLHLCGLIYNI